MCVDSVRAREGACVREGVYARMYVACDKYVRAKCVRMGACLVYVRTGMYVCVCECIKFIPTLPACGALLSAASSPTAAPFADAFITRWNNCSLNDANMVRKITKKERKKARK